MGTRRRGRRRVLLMVIRASCVAMLLALPVASTIQGMTAPGLGTAAVGVERGAINDMVGSVQEQVSARLAGRQGRRTIDLKTGSLDSVGPKGVVSSQLGSDGRGRLAVASNSGTLSLGQPKQLPPLRFAFPSAEDAEAAIVKQLGLPTNLPTAADLAARAMEATPEPVSTSDVLAGGIRSLEGFINNAKDSNAETQKLFDDRPSGKDGSLQDARLQSERQQPLQATTFNQATLAADALGAMTLGPMGMLPAAYRVIGTQDWINSEHAVNLVPVAAYMAMNAV